MTEPLHWFIARLGLTMAPPEAVPGSRQQDAVLFELGRFHRCRLRWGDRTLTINHPYGFPDAGVESIEEVLDSAAEDAWCVLSASGFEEWAERFHGAPVTDPESVLTEAHYRVHQQQARALKEFLGDVEFSHLLRHVERLPAAHPRPARVAVRPPCPFAETAA